MTPVKNAEEAGAVILNAFFEEIKLAGKNPLTWLMSAEAEAGYHAGGAVRKGRIATENVVKAVAKEEKYQGVATEELGKLQTMRDGMPVSGKTKTIKDVENTSKKNKDYALAATALGVGGLGFGYSQYKNNPNNQ